MIGKSFRIIPYTIQRLTPDINTTSIPIDTSSAFFSLSVLISCGRSEEAVRMPAVNPKICIVSMAHDIAN